MANYNEALGIPRRDGKPRKAKPSPSHMRAIKQEKEAANRLGGRITPRSGAGDVKGDVRVKGVVRIECKTTKHKSFTVTLDMVRKIEAAAMSGGEVPILLIAFNDETGKPLGEVAVVPAYLLDELCESREREQ